MSDFDRVLERLLDDPGFLAALAADPAGALRGYQLSDDERTLLMSQVVAGTGGQGPVETRTSKSGLAGMIGPVVGAFGVAAAGGAAGGAALAHGSGAADAAPELEPLAHAGSAGVE